MRRNIPQSFQLAPFAWEETYKLLDRELGINVSQFEFSQLDVKGNDEIVPNAKCLDERNDWRRYLLTMRYVAAADEAAGGTEWIVTRLIPTVEFLRYNGGLEHGSLGPDMSGAKVIGYNPNNLLSLALITDDDKPFMETVQDALDGLGRRMTERMCYNPIHNIIDADWRKQAPPFNGSITTAIWGNWQSKERLPANTILSMGAPGYSALFGSENEAGGGNHILMGGYRNKAIGARSSLIIGERNYIYDPENRSGFSDSAHILMAGTGNSLRTASSVIVNGEGNDIANATNSFISGCNNKVSGKAENISILGSNNTISENIRNTVLLGDSLCPFTSNLAAARFLSIQDRVLLLGSLADKTYQAYNSCKGQLLYVDGYTAEVDTTAGSKNLPTVAWTGGKSGQILYWENGEDGVPMPKYGPPSQHANPAVYWNSSGIQFGTLPIASGGTGQTSIFPILTDLASTTPGSALAGNIGVTGVLPISHGGTGIAENPSMLINLGSDIADDAFKAEPRPGVTGILPLSHLPDFPYERITGTPSIPASPVQSNWSESNPASLAYIQNKPAMPASPVQSNWNETNTGSLAYIQNKPAIPAPATPNNGQLTIQRNGSNVATFTANQSGNATANINVPVEINYQRWVDVNNDNSSAAAQVYTVPAYTTNLFVQGTGSHRYLRLNPSNNGDILFVFNRSGDTLYIESYVFGGGGGSGWSRLGIPPWDFAIMTNGCGVFIRRGDTWIWG